MTTVNSSSITHVCPKCEKEKLLTLEFFSQKKRVGGVYWLKHECNECRRERDRIHASSPRRKQQMALCKNSWRINNPEKLKQQRYRAGKSRAEKNGIVYIPLNESQQESAIKNFINSGAFNARKNLKEFMANSSDEEVACWYSALDKPWNNPRLTAAEKWKTRYKLDTEFHLKEKLRLQAAKVFNRGDIGDKIRAALKRNGEPRSLIKIIDYSMSELKEHLERQFTKDMTWDKFIDGKIHIDHLIPQSHFSLWEPEDVKACWALSNLRPMWARENIQKSNKILTLL